MSRFEFEGCSTHVSTQIGGLSATKGRSSWCGFFYCCIKEKRGTVFSEATRTPFTKFLVNPNWIMSLVQASKLPTSAAKYAPHEGRHPGAGSSAKRKLNKRLADCIARKLGLGQGGGADGEAAAEVAFGHATGAGTGVGVDGAGVGGTGGGGGAGAGAHCGATVPLAPAAAMSASAAGGGAPAANVAVAVTLQFVPLLSKRLVSAKFPATSWS